MGGDLSGTFLIQNGLKQGRGLSPLFLTSLWSMPSRKPKKTRMYFSWTAHISYLSLQLNCTHQLPVSSV